MEYNNSLLLQQIERQLRYIPRHEPDDTGLIRLGHLGESYKNELTVLQRLLQGDGVGYWECSIEDKQLAFKTCVWALPAFSQEESVVLHPSHLLKLMDLQKASKHSHQALYTGDIWKSPRLRDWATAKESSMLLMQCSYDSIYRTERFSAEICKIISDTQPTAFILPSTSTTELIGTSGEEEVLRQLAIMALRKVQVGDPVGFLTKTVTCFMKASTLNDWFGVLERVLEETSGMFLVMDVRVLGAQVEIAKTWPTEFRKIMSRLQTNFGICLRILLISTSPLWSESDSQPLLFVGAAPDPDLPGVRQRAESSAGPDLPLSLTDRSITNQWVPQSSKVNGIQKTQNDGVQQPKEPHPKAEQSLPQSITQHQVDIAILCALPVEADAVETLFDGQLTMKYHRAEGDTNSYTLGIIDHHHVVLVHMPGMGTRHAGPVATHCRATFPKICLVLIVGICGGVPFLNNGAEVLLGDVAISEGLVIYDFGRQYPDGFVRKNSTLESARKPPAEILGFLAKLKGRNGQRNLNERTKVHMETLRQGLGTLAVYPGASKDILFDSKYRHKHHSSACAECALSETPLGMVCEQSRALSCKDVKCDSAHLITRQRQKDMLQNTQDQLISFCPAIHIGRFASGDTVVKSGEHRDAIASNEGIIAFEMEGAGVWDNMPCVIIKGVCDYADSHKDKRWQGFAAATAAACMKAFLEGWRR
ncbi:nucleoside phosphorylase domain-containing protein [Fusarium avenaceum]|nr:nucleoside phosphorylase domain-containing protein [Fusarium avenaceum]